MVEPDIIGFTLGVPLWKFQFERSQLARFGQNFIDQTFFKEHDIVQTNYSQRLGLILRVYVRVRSQVRS